VSEGEVLDDAADPADVVAEADYRAHLMRRVLHIVRRDFQPATWQAFYETVCNGRSAAEVAAELGLRVDAVYAAVARVRRRLCRELEGCLD
jgi:RNA polymerase sigma-70 factor (ECF subfamily)